MPRHTIDFGIDLGTTNSAIAVLRGMDTEVIRNHQGKEYTPSAVRLDKSGSLVVGESAKERLDEDPGNAFAEFKLQMGTNHEYRFERSGLTMGPEDLSAEVLKSLKMNAIERLGEEISAAVITVPAAFEAPQTAATRRAAEKAGLAVSPLVLEPVAASLAYGLQSDDDKVYWLIYDLGGGTFDASVVDMRDEHLQVVNHGGDNHLGGKLIDWEIVEKLFIPELTREYQLTDFHRGNPQWRGAMAKLKQEAEEAKIRLSRLGSTEAIIDFVCIDDRSQPARLEMEVSSAEVEKLMEPYVLRSINICKKVLADQRLEVGDVEKVCLVGGPTLSPYLRDRLKDPKEGLGIKLDFSQDPITVVARGAAHFAGTQVLDIEPPQPQPGACAIELVDYEPQGTDPEPMVAGRVSPPTDGEAFGGLDGASIEFINSEAQVPWRSGKKPLQPDGAFMVQLWAQPGPNVFAVQLASSAGSVLECVPESVPYTLAKRGVSQMPLPHSLGVALISNEVLWFFEKGEARPAKRTKTLRTTVALRPGNKDDVIQFRVVEGGSPRADRNAVVGALTVSGSDVTRMVPVGSEVEFTLDIDESGIIKATAFVLVADEEYQDVINYDAYRESARDPDHLKEEFGIQRERLAKARKQAEASSAAPALARLRAIDDERRIEEVDSALQAVGTDPEAGDLCEKRLLDLRIAIDGVEDALRWPELERDARAEIEQARKAIREHGRPEDHEPLEHYIAEVERAIEAQDPDVLEAKNLDLCRFYYSVLDRKGIVQAALFEQLRGKRGQMTDQAQADQLIARGQQAMQSGDADTLRAVNQQLMSLVPSEGPDGRPWDPTA